MGLTLYSKGYTTDFDMSYSTFYRLREAIAKYVPSEPNKGTVSFLEQCDCDGKLTHRECKELLEDIKDMPDQGHYFGYLGRGLETCMTITKFKEMLQASFSNRCYLRWY